MPLFFLLLLTNGDGVRLKLQMLITSTLFLTEDCLCYSLTPLLNADIYQHTSRQFSSGILYLAENLSLIIT